MKRDANNEDESKRVSMVNEQLANGEFTNVGVLPRHCPHCGMEAIRATGKTGRRRYLCGSSKTPSDALNLRNRDAQSADCLTEECRVKDRLLDECRAALGLGASAENWEKVRGLTVWRGEEDLKKACARTLLKLTEVR